ncbi:MAG: hypothetical protein ACRDDJ_02335 [[Mycobacterium] stephanolepidis]
MKRADPLSLGNTGLEGLDEGWATRVLPDDQCARKWCEDFPPPTGRVAGARVAAGHWAPVNYIDTRLGLIHDAEFVTDTEQIGELLDEGWSWSAPRTPDSDPRWPDDVH